MDTCRIVTVYDQLSGQYFRSSIADIVRAIDVFNAKRYFNPKLYFTLNSLYSLIDGLPPISVGDYIGWKPYDQVGDIIVDYDVFDKTDIGPMCLVSYNILPVYL